MRVLLSKPCSLSLTLRVSSLTPLFSTRCLRVLVRRPRAHVITLRQDHPELSLVAEHLAQVDTQKLLLLVMMMPLVVLPHLDDAVNLSYLRQTCLIWSPLIAQPLPATIFGCVRGAHLNSRV